MSIIPVSKLYEGSGISLRPGQIVVLYAEITGTIKNVDVWLKSNVTLGTAVFDVSINGTKQFIGSEMNISSGSRHASKSGLSIAITEGDIIALEYITVATAGLTPPVSLSLKIEDGVASYTLEQFQDVVAAMFTAGSHTSWTYNDAAGTLSVDAVQLTDEEIQDKIGALLSGGANTTVTYNDGANTLVIGETTAGKTQEEIEDIVAGLLQQGSNVTLTYNDGSNTLTVAASGGGGGASALDDLSDVVISSPVTGQVIKYNGTNFVNVANAGGGGNGWDVVYKTALQTVTNSTTLTNDTELQFPVVSGKSYAYDLVAAYYKEPTNMKFWVDFVGTSVRPIFVDVRGDAGTNIQDPYRVSTPFPVINITTGGGYEEGLIRVQGVFIASSNSDCKFQFANKDVGTGISQILAGSWLNYKQVD